MNQESIDAVALSINRDRFVLSAGHGSMLLYALLHLCGYDLSLSRVDFATEGKTNRDRSRSWQRLGAILYR